MRPVRAAGGLEPGQELLARRKGGALVQLVELDSGDQLAVARPELLALGRQRPVEDERRPPGPRAPRRP